MKLIVDNNILNISTLTYRQLGFSEKLSGNSVLLFEIILTLPEFRAIIEAPFNKFVLESKDDDQKTNYADAINELVQYNYPHFNTLLKLDRYTLGKLVQRFLFFELLEGCLGKNSISGCSMAVNNISAILLEKDEVRIQGEAYPLTS